MEIKLEKVLQALDEEGLFYSPETDSIERKRVQVPADASVSYPGGAIVDIDKEGFLSDFDKPDIERLQVGQPFYYNELTCKLTLKETNRYAGMVLGVPTESNPMFRLRLYVYYLNYTPEEKMNVLWKGY